MRFAKPFYLVWMDIGMTTASCLSFFLFSCDLGGLLHKVLPASCRFGASECVGPVLSHSPLHLHLEVLVGSLVSYTLFIFFITCPFLPEV